MSVGKDFLGFLFLCSVREKIPSDTETATNNNNINMAQINIRGILSSATLLPSITAQLTKEWFSTALGRSVRGVRIVQEIHGTASKILVELTYGEDNTDHQVELPTHLCVKGGFKPQLVALHPALYLTYRREAEFYHYIAPTTPQLRLPKAFFAGSDMNPGQGLVVMEDLNVPPPGCSFGNPLVAWPVDRVRAGVAQLAALHARTWGASAADFPWLHAGENPLQGIILSLFRAEAWAVRFADAPPVPEHMTDRARMEAAFRKMWQLAATDRFQCACHGDAHLGNTFVTPAGEPGFIDWQGLGVGCAFHDVAYFVSGALAVQERRLYEEGLLEHYLNSLHGLGGPRIDYGEAWMEYRKHLLSGFAWAIAAPQMQEREVIFAMSRRHVAAIVDHGSLELLESLPVP